MAINIIHQADNNLETDPPSTLPPSSVPVPAPVPVPVVYAPAPVSVTAPAPAPPGPVNPQQYSYPQQPPQHQQQYQQQHQQHQQNQQYQQNQQNHQHQHQHQQPPQQHQQHQPPLQTQRSGSESSASGTAASGSHQRTASASLSPDSDRPTTSPPVPAGISSRRSVAPNRITRAPPSSNHKPRSAVPRDSASNAPAARPQASKPPTGGMVAAASGPMSSSVIVPSRPRPGRKPIAHEDAADRRRVQNRMAQRNFRDKRQQKLVDAMEELTNIRNQHDEDTATLKRDLQIAHNEMRALTEQIHAMTERAEAFTQQSETAEQRARHAEQRAAEAEKRAAEMEQRLQQEQAARTICLFRPSAAQPPQPGISSSTTTTPQEQEDPQDELDFTTYGLRDRADEHCGFCTDDQNCACAQEKLLKRKLPNPEIAT